MDVLIAVKRIVSPIYLSVPVTIGYPYLPSVLSYHPVWCLARLWSMGVKNYREISAKLHKILTNKLKIDIFPMQYCLNPPSTHLPAYAHSYIHWCQRENEWIWENGMWSLCVRVKILDFWQIFLVTQEVFASGKCFAVSLRGLQSLSRQK